MKNLMPEKERKNLHRKDEDDEENASKKIHGKPGTKELLPRREGKTLFFSFGGGSDV